MIEFEHCDGSISYQYERGDLVQRVKNGLIMKPGTWGVVERVTIYGLPLKRDDEEWHSSSLFIKVFPDGGHDSGHHDDFVPMPTPLQSMKWSEVTSKYMVFKVCHEINGWQNNIQYFSARRYETGLKREDLLPIALTHSGSESDHFKRDDPIHTIILPITKRIYVLPEVISEIMES